MFYVPQLKNPQSSDIVLVMSKLDINLLDFFATQIC